MLATYLGYLGTALVMASFLCDDMVRLRALNASGALLVCIYSFMISAWPVMLLNGFIFLLNSAKLLQFYFKKSA